MLHLKYVRQSRESARHGFPQTQPPTVASARRCQSLAHLRMPRALATLRPRSVEVRSANRSPRARPWRESAELRALWSAPVTRQHPLAGDEAPQIAVARPSWESQVRRWRPFERRHTLDLLDTECHRVEGESLPRRQEGALSIAKVRRVIPTYRRGLRKRINDRRRVPSAAPVTQRLALRELAVLATRRNFGLNSAAPWLSGPNVSRASAR